MEDPLICKLILKSNKAHPLYIFSDSFYANLIKENYNDFRKLSVFFFNFNSPYFLNALVS